MTARGRGLTLPEILIAAALFGTIMASITAFVRKTNEGLFHFVRRLSTEESVRLLSQAVQRDFSEMNEILEVHPSSVTFLMDSHRLPGYDPGAMVRGVPARFQPDQDGDEVYLATAPAALRFLGCDLDDDDDDADGRIDVQCRYKLDGDRLRRWFNFNENGWQEADPAPGPSNATVSRFQLTAAGAKAVSGYAAWDTNADGEVGHGEIAARGGDPARIDGRVELAAIASIQIDLEVRAPSGEATRTVAQIVPPLLLVKRKVP